MSDPAVACPHARARAPTQPDLIQRFTSLGIDKIGGTPEQYGAFIKSEIDKWTRLVKSASMKPD